MDQINSIRGIQNSCFRSPELVGMRKMDFFNNEV